jgi:hypothetical protein
MWLLFPALSYGQWSGILSASRAIDWRNAGLPSTFPDGETSPNPWTPPTRTQCGSTVTLTGNSTTDTSAINSAISACTAGHYVLIGPGTTSLGTINFKNNVTLRGSGASSTFLTGAFTVGSGYWGGSALLSSAPAKGATSARVTSGPPSGGQLVDIEQCADGFSATSSAFTRYGSGTVCAGSYSDPSGPWVCGQNTSGVCNRSNGGSVNPHFQEHILWIPTGGVSGNTVNFASPVEHPNWSTARTASITWLNTGFVGVGIEDLTLVGPITFTGTYASWIKGVRLITTSATLLLQFHFDSHSLVANSYIGNTTGGANGGNNELVLWGYDGGEQGQSDHLFISNIVDGGFTYGYGDEVGHVYAYNYYRTAGNSAWVENGIGQHHVGTMFLLTEGNEMGDLQDDDTWGAHNFNTFFRKWVSDVDWGYPSTGGQGMQIGGWARFENAIGNALQSFDDTYRGAYDLNGPVGYPTDNTGLTQSSLMRWGNYAVCRSDSHCNTSSFDSNEVPANLSNFGANSMPYQNSVPRSQNLPATFFLSNDRTNYVTAHPNGGTGLNWWKTCTSWITFPTSCASYSTPPMPPIGPDITGGQNIAGHAYNIPAAVAWANLPSDPKYPTSWGTNLKQFDERVYQSDSGGTGATNPNPPTGLTAVAQ